MLSYLNSRLVQLSGVPASAVDRGGPTWQRTSRGERVAIVDDEDAIASVTSALLQRLGYSTTSYPSAARFLKAFDAAPERIDLVIIDVVMPGMSGVQLVSTLREAGYDVPILLMTGFSVQARLETAGVPGRISFVRKPFTTTHLAQSVRRLLSAAS